MEFCAYYVLSERKCNLAADLSYAIRTVLFKNGSKETIYLYTWHHTEKQWFAGCQLQTNISLESIQMSL